MQLPAFITAALAFFSSTSEKLDKISAQSTRIAQLEADLGTARQSLSTISTERDALQATVTSQTARITALEADLKAANDNDADVDRRAALKSAEAIRALGVTPVKEENEAASTAASGDLEAQFMAIKDPVARSEFYRNNEKAIKSAARAKRGA